MSKAWFYSLVPFFFIFFCFLIRSLNSFCSSFYYCNWPENSSHHAYSRHHTNYESLIFPTTTLIPGTTLIKNAHLSHHHAYSGQHVYSEGKSIFLYLKKVYFAQKQPPKVFYKKVIFKNFAIFTQKTSVLESFLIQLQAWRPVKRGFNAGVFQWIL